MDISDGGHNCLSSFAHHYHLLKLLWSCFAFEAQFVQSGLWTKRTTKIWSYQTIYSYVCKNLTIPIILSTKMRIASFFVDKMGSFQWSLRVIFSFFSWANYKPFCQSWKIPIYLTYFIKYQKDVKYGVFHFSWIKYIISDFVH